MSAVPDLPDELTLQFFADVDAAEAVDALRHVDADIGMGVVNEARICFP
jgi:hypothetical protein